MNIEIANRLVNLRKSNNYSQEALAEKLGISRQAVSKWERAEASPDTDNLILLSRLYGVSLDELLTTVDEIPRPEPDNTDHGGGNTGNTEATDHSAFGSDSAPPKEDYVHIGLSGIHVKDKDGSEVHVGWNGVHVDDRKNKKYVDIDKNGVFVDGERYDYDHDWFSHDRHKFPVAIIIVIAYLLIGAFFGLWHPGWLIFLLIPIWYSFVEAVHRKNAHIFAYPVVAAMIFLMLGMFRGAWHPGWTIFITVPLYYSLVSYLQGMAKYKNRQKAQAEKVPDADGEKR